MTLAPSRLDAGRTRSLLLLLGAALTITVVAWPFTGRVLTGQDPSWGHALHLARELGLRFGSELIYTYGPLGFLSVPSPPVGVTSSVALVVSGAIYLALVGMAIRGLWRIMPLWAAIVGAFVLARMLGSLPPFEALQALVFLLAVDLVLGRATLDDRIVVVSAAAVAAIAVLGKLNVGVFIAAMSLVAVAATTRRPWLGVVGFLGTSVVIGLGLWLLLGQQLGDITGFARSSLEIVAGYSQAMGTDRDPPSRHWIFLAFPIVVAILAWLAVLAARDLTRPRRLALFALLAILAFAEWKTAFVRGYPGFAFATFGFAATALVASAGRQTAVLALAAIVVAFLGSAPATQTSPTGFFDVVSSTKNAARAARDQLVPWRIADSAAATEATLREAYALSPTILAEVLGRRTHVEPAEVGVARAYSEIVWAPLPVFQNLQAYTARLDDLNVAVLQGTERPDRILREYDPTRIEGRPYTVDGRFYWWDAPSTMFERLCRYREIRADERWQVLAATEAHCGDAVPLATVEARAGETIAVPSAPADQVVTVHIDGVETGLLDRVRTTLLEAREWYVTLDDDEPYRLIPGTTGQELVVAVPATIGGSAPFAFGPAVTSIRVGSGKDSDESTEPLTFEFFAHPIIDPASSGAS